MQEIYLKILNILQTGTIALVKLHMGAKSGEVNELETLVIPVQTPKELMSHMSACSDTLCYAYIPSERLILLGGGHIALPLCEFASKTGFKVTVVDDRPRFASKQRFPYAKETICEAFPAAIKNLKITPNDYVAVITRGHHEDEACLKALLEGTWPNYVGLIRSRRRVGSLFDKLVEDGFDKEKLETICTPIGLSIGAQTPEEISISILSELIKVKRTINPLKSTDNLCLCYDTLEFLEQITQQDEPFAMVMILSTKGSTPRKAGAIMAVTKLGYTIGSIGGGCSENQVIHIARNMIGSASYKVVTLDLTSDFAEDEGMVCGGTMEVLIVG